MALRSTPIGRTSASLGNRDYASEHNGRAVPGGSCVLALSESSLRLGIRGEQQPKTGIGLPGTHISVAQSRRRDALRDSAAAIGEMREIAKRTFHGLACVPTHRTGLPAIQTNCGACDPSQATCPDFRCDLVGWSALPRSAGYEERA